MSELIESHNGFATETSSKESWKVSYDKEKTKLLRQKCIGASCQIFFKKDPLKIVRGDKQYLFDECGKRYLDCINNVSHVGHCHPVVVSACSYQMQTLNTNSRYLHDNILNLAQKITATLPEPLTVCYFCNSGSEANDLALRLARYYTHNTDTIVLDHAYHGHVISTMSISPYKFKHEGCEEKQPAWVHVVPTPDSYRGKYRDTEYSLEQLGHLYAEEVKLVCHDLMKRNLHPAAFIAESMQSCGGQVIFPPNYLRLVYKYVREAGGVCITDEVQTGFGRVGSHMWAFQLQGDDIVPDIVTMGKPMGNGYPISCVVTTPAIAAAFRRGPDYFNTFGGNPVSCAIGLAVMDILKTEGLLAHAMEVGSYAKEEFLSLMENHRLVGDVRGAGLFVGIDLVKNRETREPAKEEALQAIYLLRERGVIMSVDGPFENILKLKPPMCFSKEDVDLLVRELNEVLYLIEGGQLDETRSAVSIVNGQSV